MPLKKDNYLVPLGSCKATKLPPEALMPTRTNVTSIISGDFLKVAVRTPIHSIEYFWVKYQDSKEGSLRCIISNDLELTPIHGLSDGELINIGLDQIHGILKNKATHYV